MATLRFELLEQTVRSIEKAFPLSELFLIDNGSTDGSWEAVGELLGKKGIECRECTRIHADMHGIYPPWEKTPPEWGEPPGMFQRGRWHTVRGGGGPRGNVTPGAGRHRLQRVMWEHLQDRPSAATHPPFWVWSDDDMLWKPDAEAKLRRFYAEKPNDIAVVSGLLEPVWHWNAPRETVEAGGVRVLVRDSAPGAAWTFAGYRVVPLGLPAYWCFGYDYEACKYLRAHGQKVAQIDLADHIGWECSTHGNDADQHIDGRPLDRERWGV
jgi:hypothetical protein